MEKVKKYPRTPHIESSNLQKGDYDLSQIPFSYLKDKYLVIEEKIDGSNVGISFIDGELKLQNRSHYLQGGYKERQYDLFKVWANSLKEELYKIIGERYIIYGEWMYAKHNIFYDQLPHYFIEFDIYDKLEEKFLDTEKRKQILKNSPIISVPVLKEGKFKSLDEIIDLMGNSHFISNKYVEHYQDINIKNKDPLTSTNLMEGLYIKVESEGEVKERFKFVRKTFKQVQEENDSFYKKELIPNQLSADLDALFNIKNE